ncbi:recombinase family protein [Streptomyces sp. NPDC056672]|uniref:recombinase family protein n=1 Tax=Streptomyces sp. NPDC056672 TaxID=3345906 RepID=UPI003683B6C7
MIKKVTTTATDVTTTPYDGCGKCLVGVRRLSRKTDKTNSPGKQRDQIVRAVEAIGGHIIAWADDIEVSGATDPTTRAGFGPWLRGEMGPYGGIAGSAVDRIGRNARDVLNTAYTNDEAGRILVTADHVGVWDLSDPNQEAELLLKSMGSQLEHRAIRTRNRDETKRARSAGQKKNQNAYGYQFVRLTPLGRIDHVALDKAAATNARDIAHRILTDETGTITPATEAARLTRAGVLSPADHRRVMYGKKPQGSHWTAKAVMTILTSEASLGFLMHAGRPVIGEDGHPVRLAPGLWDRETRDALIKKTSPRRRRSNIRAPKMDNRLSGLAFCGTCKQRLYISGQKGAPTYRCTARISGIVSSQNCKPAPSIRVPHLDAYAEAWFLAHHGAAQVMRKEFDPGTGYAARISDLEADRKRLRDDRSAGLYNDPDDAEWFRTEYARMGREISELKTLPERPAGMRMVPTGKTVADEWHAAADDSARREMLAAFEVRVILHPRSAQQRIEVTARNPFINAARHD